LSFGQSAWNYSYTTNVPFYPIFPNQEVHLLVRSNGNLVVVITDFVPLTDPPLSDIWVFVVASDGTLLSCQVYSIGDPIEVSSTAFDNVGNLLVYGRTLYLSNFLVSIAPSGSVNWARSYNTSTGDTFTSFTTLPNNGFLLLSSSNTSVSCILLYWMTLLWLT
jgi:hypothetical protein